MKTSIKLFALALAAATAMSVISCSKTLNNQNTGGGTDGTATATAKDLLYDSLYYYAQQVYYWNTQLPSYSTFNPRQYEQSNDSSGLANEQFAYTRYAVSPTGLLYEQLMEPNDNGTLVADNSSPKYSQIYYTTDLTNGTSASAPNGSNNFAMSLNGLDNSFGLMVGFLPASYAEANQNYNYTITSGNQDSTVGVIQYVMTGSPAYNAGLRRGDMILTYNGQAWNYDNNISNIENALFSTTAASLQLSVYDPYQQKTVSATLQSGTYTFNPIFKSTVLTEGSHKIAYLSFYTFTDSSNAVPFLDTAFASYTKQGVTDIVVDLRYNGGGYVNTAENLVNLLAPSSANGKVMHVDYYNQTMINGQATMLENVPVDYDNPTLGNMYNNVSYTPANNTTNINKVGSVNSLTKVYFIVSSNTASASEMVINTLSPYVSETQLSAWWADTSSFTYGKPVAFFEIRIGQFSEFTPNFEMKNANGYGDYFQGLQSNLQETISGYSVTRGDDDDITHDFGDPLEYCFSDMIYAIAGVNTYNTQASSPRIISLRSINSGSIKRKSIGSVPNLPNIMIAKPKINKR